jgi:enamine deaminase RidA (YjgF/YER057c/UK114 family)
MSADHDIGALVDAQVSAYNAHDLDRFLSFFTEDSQFYDFPNTLRFEGREAVRARYGAMFEANPRLMARITTRIVAPPFVIDHESLFGHERRADGVSGVVTYQFAGPLIARVWSGGWSDRPIQQDQLTTSGTVSMRRFETTERMSQAVVYGDLIFISGQVDKSKRATVAEQTAAILAQIDALLADAGSDKACIVSCNIWLADIGSFTEMNSVWDKWVEPGAAPARATVEARLADPKYHLEIACIAARKVSA